MAQMTAFGLISIPHYLNGPRLAQFCRVFYLLPAERATGVLNMSSTLTQSKAPSRKYGRQSVEPYLIRDTI